METVTVADGRYELRRLIGRGGMADVWAARDLVGDRDVAVKVLRGVEAEHEARFAEEVRALGLVEHPNLVRFLDAGEHEGQPFLVMELVEGATLADALRDGPLPAERVTDVGRALARALAAIHELGIVHRDVKPGNVLVGEDGTVRLADFGIARLVDGAGLTTSGATMGTAAYLAPEQVEGHAVGPPTDVYALGLVLLEAFTGRREFDGAPMEAAMARLTRDPGVPTELAAPWPALLASMTARDPGGRPPAADVAARLGRPSRSAHGADGAVPADDAPTERLVTATQRLDLPPRPVPEPEPVAAAPSRRPRRPVPALGRAGWAAVAGVVVALLVAVLVMSTRQEADPVGAQPGTTAPQAATTASTLPEGFGDGGGAVPVPLDDAIDELEELVRP